MAAEKTQSIRVMIVDDHDMVRDGLRLMLENCEDLECAGEAKNADSASWGGRIRTYEWRIQSPLPYHLATPHYLVGALYHKRVVPQAGFYSKITSSSCQA